MFHTHSILHHIKHFVLSCTMTESVVFITIYPFFENALSEVVWFLLAHHLYYWQGWKTIFKAEAGGFHCILGF